MARRGSAVLVSALVIGLGGVGHADRMREAKDHFRRALGAYGVGRYTEAAEEYEAAFRLQPDPALLYDAAQARRLEGNLERALELYQSYVSLFAARVRNLDDVRRRIDALKRELDKRRVTAAAASRRRPATPEPEPAPVRDPRVTENPPLTNPPLTNPPLTNPPESAATAAATPSATATVVATAPPRRPWWKRGATWGIVGAVIAVGVGVGVGLGLGLHPSSAGTQTPPPPSFGRVSF